MIRQIAWKVLQAAVMVFVTVYVFQNLWEDTRPNLRIIVALVAGVLAAAAVTAVINETCSRRPWPFRAIQLILLLGCVLLGWKENPIGAIVFGLLTTLSITIAIDMGIALVARIKARLARPPREEPTVQKPKAGRKVLTPP